ncbi:hypothetical protein [Parendozoicomonas sp. Alg238-R29]|uniref:hypothetical protein n=1 Tax=Parendozoicomonas sp. Alg238-R29 TaxID=2993446 RepID=UPI00248F414A|nr:hypothetical protein [Parendozoicomonas sp. Alg238-R29]
MHKAEITVEYCAFTGEGSGLLSSGKNFSGLLEAPMAALSKKLKNFLAVVYVVLPKSCLLQSMLTQEEIIPW